MTSPVTLLTATTDGSSTTMPRPRTEMIVLAEPMSIAIESETRFLRALRPRRVLVFPMNDIKKLPIANCQLLIARLLNSSNRQSAIGNRQFLERAAGSLPINLPEIHGLLAIFDHDRFAWLQFIAAVCCLCSCIADQNLTATCIRLQSRRSVHSISDGRVFRAAFGADISHDHFPGV